MGDSKLSIDNMVELAMGLSMASLFSQAMNSTFQNTVRTLGNDQVAAPPKFIYAMIDGRQAGPMSLGEVAELIRGGKITMETYIWKPGMAEWKPAKEVNDVSPSFEVAPPEAPNL